MLLYTKLNDVQLEEALQGKFNDLKNKILQSQGLLSWEGVKLTLDYEKLARVALNRQRKPIAKFLISKEVSLSKKIMFYLEAGFFEEALKLSIEDGDPKFINKAFSYLISKTGEGEAV
jgi:hypothetical protein